MIIVHVNHKFIIPFSRIRFHKIGDRRLLKSLQISIKSKISIRGSAYFGLINVSQIRFFNVIKKHIFTKILWEEKYHYIKIFNSPLIYKNATKIQIFTAIL